MQKKLTRGREKKREYSISIISTLNTFYEYFLSFVFFFFFFNCLNWLNWLNWYFADLMYQNLFMVWQTKESNSLRLPLFRICIYQFEAIGSQQTCRTLSIKFSFPKILRHKKICIINSHQVFNMKTWGSNEMFQRCLQDTKDC